MGKYDKWIEKNTHLLTDKLAIVVGATGSIGTCIADYLLQLQAHVIIAARNIEKAETLKRDLLIKYPNGKIDIEYLDISSLESIDDFQLEIDKKYPKVDIFINNAGVYHLPKTSSKEGYEIHFATNTLGNYYLAKKIIYDLKENAKMIFVSSLSANFYEIDLTDIQSMHCSNKMKVYGRSKRMMMANILALKNSFSDNQVFINLVHPGVCATELFEKSHSKFFMKVIYPLMKLIFHSPKKAALNVIKAIFTDTKLDEWITPKGLFEVWGYPKVKRMNKKLYNAEYISQVEEITENMIAEHCKI